MTTIGIIGAGHIGSQLARAFIGIGYDVVIANSRGPETLADLVEATGVPVTVHHDLSDAAEAAREWAASSERRAVVIAGSVVLAGEALRLAAEQDWKDGWSQ